MEPIFDHEKLDLYRVELELVTWIRDFMRDACGSPTQHRRELIEQLDRASLSMLLNTAEGNSKRHGRHRAKFFDDARGSAFECAACLDASVAKQLALPDRIRPGKEMLVRVVAMLTRLIDRFDVDDPPIRKDLIALPSGPRRRPSSFRSYPRKRTTTKTSVT